MPTHSGNLVIESKNTLAEQPSPFQLDDRLLVFGVGTVSAAEKTDSSDSTEQRRDGGSADP